eukprot:TRINITY_DN25209_c0_g1_i1.p1 TRINITY_DN25209_c0_g1~~TRINITY_DN25209_c0_g1_i1.p1  ORF type:complete len:469 (+),score=15.95 TRINITY_DN25209_c0_g1_i1:45-1451(+)
MEHYRNTAKALKGAFYRDLFKGEDWEYFSPKWIFFRENVIWARDCRMFLRDVHSAGITSKRTLLDNIPLANIEAKVRKYRMVSRDRDSAATMMISKLPVVRDFVLAKRGILYSHSSASNLAFVKRWCADMRELEEKTAYSKKEKIALEGKSGPASQSGSPKAQWQNDELITEFSEFSKVPRDVFFATLVSKAKLRTRKDVLRLFITSFVMFCLMLIIVARDYDRYLLSKCMVRLFVLNALGYPQTKSDLAAYLCNQVCEPMPDNDPLPDALVCEDNVMKIRVHTLQDNFNSQIIVVPVPELATERFYWSISTILKKCSLVTIQFYSARDLCTQMEPAVFFPAVHPEIPILRVYNRFLPIFYGDAPHPEVIGGHSHFSFLLFEIFWPSISFPYGMFFSKEIAALAASRSAQYNSIGVTHHPYVTQGISRALIGMGYRHTRTDQYEIFNGNEAADALLAVYPVLGRYIAG